MGETWVSGVQAESDRVGVGEYSEWKKTRVSYEECGTEMAAFSFRHHMEISHRIVIAQTRWVDIGIRVPETYVLYFKRVLNFVVCLVDGCLERAHSTGRLREHFMYQHCKLKVLILQEVPAPLPRCDQCGMHMTKARMDKHSRMFICNKSTKMSLRQRDEEMVERCG